MPWVYKTCDAKTRKGTPCRNTRLFKNGRCKLHGGLSTGPKTLEGRLKVLSNLKGVRDKDLAAIAAAIKPKRPVRIERRYVWSEPV
jgi:hypothetical protein